MSSELLLVDLPREIATRARPVLDIHMEEGFATGGLCPVVTANVFPVWNSVACRYPAFPEAEQVISRTRGRLVHPLQPLAMGSSWRAWSVLRVGAAGDSGLVATDDTRRSERGYHLAYLPHGSVGRVQSEARRILGIVLEPTLARELERRDQRLAVDYLSTMGSAANGIPAGAEFQLIDTTGTPGRHRVLGRFLSRSFGAHDGLAGSAACVGDDDLAAVLPASESRTVGQAAAALRQAFGAEFGLVDEADLVRRATGTTIAPLHVRVRFRDSRPVLERRALLRAGQAFLERYLDRQAVGRVFLVEQGGARNA
jgi:hypothetical protein